MQHILVFQNGDYGAAYRRLAQGEPETYRNQKASVDLVADLARRFRVTTLSIGDRPHHEEVAENLWSLGISPATAYSARKILPLLNRLAPDRVVLRTPHRYCLLWTRARCIPTLPVFADIFRRNSLRQRIENRLTRWTLSGPNVPCVANHSLNASLSMQAALNLPASRIVPWDRPPLTPDPEAKAASASPHRATALYAGAITESKGIGDCLSAAAMLKDQGFWLGIDIAGAGDLAFWRAQAETLGIADRIHFLGPRPNDEVRRRMRAADLVLVPSRHDYAEGLPNTLCEALAARTPAVISDHPAFASRLQDERDCLMFRAGDPADMARQILRLVRDGDLQVRLSRHAPEALASLRFGLDWFNLIRLYAEDPGNRTAWVEKHNLPSLLAQTTLLTQTQRTASQT